MTPWIITGQVSLLAAGILAVATGHALLALTIGFTLGANVVIDLDNWTAKRRMSCHDPDRESENP